MQLKDYFDFIAPNDIRLKGHRIGIESILYEYIHNALTPEDLLVRFPTLNLEQIHATILYYLQNKQQVEKYLADWLEHGDKMRKEQSLNPSPSILKLRQLRTKRKHGKQDLSEAEIT